MHKKLNLSSVGLQLNTSLRIDRENLVLYDVVAMQAGVEALGWDCQADLKTLQMMADLGNRLPHGLRMRFGHPGMSESAEGKKLAIADHFRVDGDTLRHDVHFMDAARLSPVFAQDPIEYIFHMAETQPRELAESAVVRTNLVWTLPDGREFNADDEQGMFDAGIEMQDGRPADALTPFPVIRPVNWYFVDFVSEGALTHDGLFNAEFFQMMFAGTSNVYAQQVFDLLDEWRDDYNIPLEAIPQKVNQVVSKYLYARGLKEPNMTQLQNLNPQNPPEGTQPAPATETPPAPVEQKSSVDELAGAESTAAATSETLTTPAPAPAAEQPETVSVEEYRRVVGEVKELRGVVERLIRLTALNTQNIAHVANDVKRIDGEPVMRTSVPKSGAIQQMQAGTPPANLRNQTPGSISGSNPTPPLNFEQNIEQATFEATALRQRQLQQT